MRRLLFPGCGMFISSFLIVVGLFFLFVFPSLFDFFVNKEFQLSPGSQIFRHWRKTPIPVTLDVYFFNWTNPERLGKDKPAFNEMGPYRFYEVREKVNITWNDNSTISYRQRRTWHFNQEESNGSLSDVITTVDAVSLTAAYRVRNSKLRGLLDIALKATFPEPSVRHSVRELLFDGYTNNLLTLAHKLPISRTTIPYDKFAWFYERNNSFTMDGYFNLDTGASNMSNVGRIHNWNYQNQTDFYPGDCGQVRGFTGDLFAPGLMHRDTQFSLFSQELCQKLPFAYFRDAEVHGLPTYQYSASLRDPYTQDSEDCCNGECVPGGFLNLTACRFGAPVFLSFPHFYNSNPFYLNLVDGLRPDPDKHRFYFTIEPTLGVPVDVRARVQLNMYMQSMAASIYEDVPRMMMPILWADQGVTITPPLARELRLVLMLPSLALGTGIAALISGTVICIALLLLRANKRIEPEEPIKTDVTITTSVH